MTNPIFLTQYQMMKSLKVNLRQTEINPRSKPSTLIEIRDGVMEVASRMKEDRRSREVEVFSR